MNLALNKLPLEPYWTTPELATDGNFQNYTGSSGYTQATWPCSYTIDLNEIKSIASIQFLLWDNMGRPTNQIDKRKYRYSLEISTDQTFWVKVREDNNEGFNGWQIFTFTNAVEARFIKLNCLKNSDNDFFHIVEFEIHDDFNLDLSTKINTKTFIIDQTKFDQTNISSIIDAALNNKFSDLNHKIKQALDSSASSNTELSGLVESSKEKAKSLSNLLTTLNLLGESLNFQAESTLNKKTAMKWLITSIILVLVFFTYLIFLLYFNLLPFYELRELALENYSSFFGPQQLSSSSTDNLFIIEIIRLSILKLIIISAMLYLISISFRNYKINMHNYTINIHKSLSILSVEQLINKALNSEYKDKILLQATEAIFTHQNSGFNSNESDFNPSIVNSIVETVTSKASK